MFDYPLVAKDKVLGKNCAEFKIITPIKENIIPTKVETMHPEEESKSFQLVEDSEEDKDLGLQTHRK